jgi:CheY-like chemotaxis protein
MSRRVLLVDTDVDALGELASALRARGIVVANASDAFEAVEQAFKERPNVVLVERRLADEQDVVRAFEAVPELADVPVLHLVSRARGDGLSADEVPRNDLDQLVSRIALASPRASHLSLEQELRGNLEQMPMVDLLQLLAMNRKSGVLGVATAYGAGEIRVSDGEVIDSVYRRLEGEKAFYRLLGEHEGRFAFSPGEPVSVRRLTSRTSHLLMEAMRQVDEVRRLREALGLRGEAIAVDDGPLPAGLADHASLVTDLTRILGLPRSLDDLLDEHPATDLAILDTLAQLEAAGRVRRVPLARLTTPLAAVEQLPVLRSLVTRLTRGGFAAPLRLVVAATSSRIDALANTVRRITDAVPSTDPAPTVSVPRPLGTLRLGDGVDLALTGLPTDDKFAPTWTLVLPGAVAVVRIAGAGGTVLEAHCEAVEVLLIDAESALGAFDASAPEQLAALVRSALELAAGV